MPKLTKILSLFFLMFLFIQLAFFILPAGLTLAAEPIKPPKLQVQIGQTTIPFEAVSCEGGQNCEIGWLSQYISVVYRYGVGLAAILATVMIMIGGFLWLTSGGSPDRVGKAKEFITGALTGLLLALFSFMILYTINPQLVALKPLSITAPSVSTDLPDYTTQCESDDYGDKFYLISSNYGDKNKIDEHCKNYCQGEYKSTDYCVDKSATGDYRCYCGVGVPRPNYVVEDKEITMATIADPEREESVALDLCSTYGSSQYSGYRKLVCYVNFTRREDRFSYYSCWCYTE